MAMLLVGFGCGGETDAERCCECLVSHDCTDADENHCIDVFYGEFGEDSIEVDSACVGQNGCYLSCASGGAHFEDGRMVVIHRHKSYR